jgi:hypothetical protein
MNFDIKLDDFEYDEQQIRRLIFVLDDGSLVLTGLFTPLAVTDTGRPGIFAGDCIYDVDTGVVEKCHAAIKDPDKYELLRSLKGALMIGGKFTLTVATRPEFFDIELRCDGPLWHKLGCQVTIEREHIDRIKVQAVQNVGLVPQWNVDYPDSQVMPGDWIIAVNGEGETAQDMTKAIQTTCHGDILELCIQSRPRMMKGSINAMNLRNNPRSKQKQGLPGKVMATVETWSALKLNNSVVHH